MSPTSSTDLPVRLREALQSAGFTYDGVAALLRTVQLVAKRLNPGLAVTAVLPTQVRGREVLSRDVLAQLSQTFPDQLLPAIAEADAILVRSATKVDDEALAAGKRLKVVARAGVGE